MINKFAAAVATLVVLSFGLFCQSSLGKDEPVLIEIAGKVTDEHKVPVKKALVILTDRDGRTSQRTRTDGHGHFTFAHQPSGTETLQVIPSPKSGFAQAVLNDVPGDEGRHVLISVRKGFLVRGRVTFGEQPLKNVTVRVRPHDSDTVHGGGETVTDGKGAFQLVLTPGQKTIEITDIVNQQAVGTFKQAYTVTADGQMPEIKVPAGRPASSQK